MNQNIIREIKTILVGIKKINEDGIESRELIELLNPGDKLDVHWDSETCCEGTRIYLESDSGIVGELSKGVIKDIFEEISTECFAEALVEEVSENNVVSVILRIIKVSEYDDPTIDKKLYDIQIQLEESARKLKLTQSELELHEKQVKAKNDTSEYEKGCLIKIVSFAIVALFVYLFIKWLFG